MSKALDLYTQILTDYGLEEQINDHRNYRKLNKALKHFDEDSVYKAILDCETYLEEYWCERNKEKYKTDNHKVRYFTKMILGTLYNRRNRVSKILEIQQ